MKLLYVLFGWMFFAMPVFADVSSVAEQPVTTTEFIAEIAPMDYDSMASRPYYPNILYPNLSQEDMLKAAYDVERKTLSTLYWEAIVAKLDALLDRLVFKAQTVAKTKEWQAMFLGEYISKIQMVQGMYTNSTKPIIHVINYIWYALSIKTLSILYGDLDENVDELLSWIEGK